MLAHKGEDRPTIEEIKEHPWMKQEKVKYHIPVTVINQSKLKLNFRLVNKKN